MDKGKEIKAEEDTKVVIYVTKWWQKSGIFAVHKGFIWDNNNTRIVERIDIIDITDKKAIIYVSGHFPLSLRIGKDCFLEEKEAIKSVIVKISRREQSLRKQVEKMGILKNQYAEHLKTLSCS